jgi:hypothetical protein
VKRFLKKFGPSIKGVLSGFDRLVFRGTLRSLMYQGGMMAYLCYHRILLKDFGEHAEWVTEQVRNASLARAEQQGRPNLYLEDSKLRKDDLAREIAARDGIDRGLVCILRAVEPCRSFDVRKNAATRQLETCVRWRKCLHLYHYLIHPVFGFMNVRLQTWYPFEFQVCINGREWLSRQLDRARIPYRRHKNCFTELGDYAAAQGLFDQQLDVSWPRLLKGLVALVNPAARKVLAYHPPGRAPEPMEYYWSVIQSEVATDIVWKSREALQPLYRRLVRDGITLHGPGDVLRYFGRRTNADGSVRKNFGGEITSSAKTGEEGVRLKHYVRRNSLKIYDKQNVLRFEMTMNDPSDFQVYRHAEGQTRGKRRWLPLRKGIADLKRRAQVSLAANRRLIDAQASLCVEQPLEALAASLCRPVRCPRPHRGSDGGEVPPSRRFRALNPLAAGDAALLAAIARPEWCENGLRNRDLRALLYPQGAADEAEKRRQSAAVSRRLALLRAHGLIFRVTGTHRYHVTASGRLALTAVLAARQVSVEQLLRMAA